MICFLRCSIIESDIRLKKYIDSLKDRNVKVIAITWDRLGNGKHSDFETVFLKKALYGKYWKNFFNKFLWQIFSLYQLFKKKDEYCVIHACNFETMLPALFMKVIYKKKIIYDVYDYFSIGFGDNLIKKIDSIFIHKSDLLIIADNERKNQMNLRESSYTDLLVVENVPLNFDMLSINKTILNFKKLSFNYVGVFDKGRGLEDLLNCVSKNSNMYCEIAGTGAIESSIKEFANKCDRITFHGVVSYKKGLEIMYRGNFVVGMYYKVASNHIYAAPNKYFEALFLGKPLLTTVGTMVGKKTLKNNTGYVIEEGEQNIQKFIDSIIEDPDFLEQYIIKVENAKKTWGTQYADYYERHLKGIYVDKVIKMLNY